MSHKVLTDTFNAFEVYRTDKSNLKCSLIISEIFSILISLICTLKIILFLSI